MASSFKSTAGHKAIFLENDASLPVREISEEYIPTGSQSLVQVHFSAINPADVKHAYVGLSGSVAGYEFVGTVVKTGEESPFKVDEVVMGFAMPGSQRPHYKGAHQDYLIAEEYMTWRVPASLSQQQAISLPVGAQTAFDAIFNMLGYGFPEASIKGKDAKNQAILIWGGASLCGLSAIQIAKRAGFSPIFTTASEKNHAYLKDLGATHCFDYRSPNVVEEIRNAVKQSGKTLATVFDAVAAGLGIMEPEGTPTSDLKLSSPTLAHACCSDVPDDQLLLCGVLPVAHDPLWRFCVGGRPRGRDGLLGEQDPEFPERIVKFMDWFLENMASSWKFPKISVVKGEKAAVEQLKRVYEGKVSMEKCLIQWPL